MAGGICGGGHAWQGACMVGRHVVECVWQRGCVTGGHAWWWACKVGGVHGGACMVRGHMWWGHAWQGACMAGGHAWFDKYHGIRSMSGWYASYWNAFLFDMLFAENSTKMKGGTRRGASLAPFPLCILQ